MTSKYVVNRSVERRALLKRPLVVPPAEGPEDALACTLLEEVDKLDYTLHF